MKTDGVRQPVCFRSVPDAHKNQHRTGKGGAMRTPRLWGLSWKERVVLIVSALSAALAAALVVAGWHVAVITVLGADHPSLLLSLADRLGGALVGVPCLFLVG